MVCCISSIMAMILMIFNDTIYSNNLLDIGVSEDYIGNLTYLFILEIGYFFMGESLVYTLACPFIGYICKFVPKIYILQVAFFLSSISLFMFGPSKILLMPQ